ncbi:hypothetical protein C6Q14_10015 [Burkholderia ambifaria]|nr:hypothetical protein C6Q14_10015 [Burkholderia ambifaria]
MAVRKWGSGRSLHDGGSGCSGRSGRSGTRNRSIAPLAPAVCRIRCVPRSIRRDRLRARPKSTRIAQIGFR